MGSLSGTTLYNYVVIAVNISGNSDNSNSIIVTTAGTLTALSNGNWNDGGTFSDVPTDANDVNIPVGKDITVANNGTCNNLILSGNLTIELNKTLTVTGNLTITDDGNLKNLGTIVVNGEKVMERLISGGNYHLMSFPISGIGTSDIAPQTAGTHIQWYGEGTNPHWNEVTSAGALSRDAYAIKYASTTTMSITSTNNFKLGGPLNIANTNSGYGWTLVGNPFPCSIDLLTLEDDFSNVRNNTVHYMGAGGSYISYNATGTGSGTGSQYIPKMQGFLVQCRIDGGEVHDISATYTGSINFTDVSKVIETPDFYKKVTENTELKLKVSNENYFHEAIIGFNENASNDYDTYDSDILFADNVEVPHIYTVIGESELVINTYSSPMTENLAVTVGFKVGVAGDYTISTNVFEAFSSEQNLYLEDKETNEFINLQDNLSYTFHTEATDGADRFVLHFANPTVGIEDIKDVKNINIYTHENTVYVKGLISNQTRIVVYDMFGKEVASEIFENGDLNTITLDKLATGNYVVKLTTDNDVKTKTVFIQK